MKLIKMNLTNFEGIKSLEITPDGKSMSVYGDNGTGKTTLADAQAWLLFGKDSKFTANFTPKMRGEDGEEIHNIDCSVKAVYEIDGVNVTLEKTMREDWKKKRGSSETVFSGHTISYSIDGIPKKEKEFNDFLSGLSELQNLMLLSVPEYFPEILDIKKRRSLLMSLTENVSDFDVINSNEQLKPLYHMMLKPGTTQVWYSIDEFLKICKSKSTESNKELKEIPGRIDEVNRIISENKTDNEKLDIKKEYANLLAEKTKLQSELNASEKPMVVSLRTDISKAELELSEARTNYSERCRQSNSSINDEISRLTSKKYEIKNAVNLMEMEKENETKRLESLNKQRSEIMEKYLKLRAETWNGDEICHTCGQAIPEEEIEKSIEQFNLNKAKELEKLNNYGKENCSKDMIAELQFKIEKRNEEINKLNSELEEIKSNIKEAESHLTVSEKFEDTTECKQIQNKIDGMKAQISVLEKSDNTARQAVKMQIEDIDSRIFELNTAIAKNEAAENAKKRIEELEAEEKKISQAYADAQQGIDLCELFSRVKADMMTDKINSKFNNVRFRLFKTQINGGIQDDCEVMALTSNGYIPYSTANNAARINAGLEIIRTFSKELGFEMPVFVDNAESITKLDTNGLQVIRLVVSESDKTLRFEREEN